MAKKQKPQTIKYQKVRSTQSFLPIREIRDGVIITKDGRFVKILEVIPSNFYMKSPMEKNDIIAAFQGMLRIAPGNLQFKVITTRADVEEHLRVLRREMKSETNPVCLDMQKDFQQTLTRVGTLEGLTHRYFIAFDYDAGYMRKNPPFAQIRKEMDATALRITEMMNACGNSVAEVRNQDAQLREILYSILNRKRREKISDERQVYSVMYRYATTLGISDVTRLPHIPITEFIAPQSISFDMPQYAVIDGRYYSWWYIPSNGYNSLVYAGWLGTEINMYEGIDVDVFLRKDDAGKIRKKLKQLIQHNRILMEDISDSNQSYEGMQTAQDSAIYIQDGLRSGEQYYQMCILFTVSADTKDQLKEKEEELKDALEVQMMHAVRLYAQQELGFLSTLPLANIDPALYGKAKRNVLTSGAASSYPFLSYEICDPDGLYIGLSKDTGTMVSPDIFDKSKYANSNIFVCGRTGAGKTFTLLTIATRARLKHIPVYIVAPIKGEEYINVCHALGGQYIKFGAGSPNRINVMEIRRKDESANALLYADYEDLEESYLAAKIQDLITFFSLIVPDITLEERQVLDDVLVGVYAAKGITLNNDSLKNDDGTWIGKKMPILEDAYNALLGNSVTVRIANIIKQLVFGSAASFNGETNVNLDNPLTVLDLTPLGKSETLLAPGMFIAIEYMMSRAMEDSTQKKLLFFDEWWRFTLSDYAAKYTMEIARVIRAYGGGAVFATQQLSDATSGSAYSKAVLDACKTKIILGLEVDEAEYVQKVLRLTDAETHEVMRNPTGTALLVTNNNNLTIQIRVSEKEVELFSTDRESKQRRLYRKRKENSGHEYTEEEAAARISRVFEDAIRSEEGAETPTAQKEKSAPATEEILKEPEPTSALGLFGIFGGKKKSDTKSSPVREGISSAASGIPRDSTQIFSESRHVTIQPNEYTQVKITAKKIEDATPDPEEETVKPKRKIFGRREKPSKKTPPSSDETREIISREPDESPEKFFEEPGESSTGFGKGFTSGTRVDPNTIGSGLPFSTKGGKGGK